MKTPYLMPKLAMAMNEGTVSEWLVQPGSQVVAGQPLACIETEKVAYDVESPEAGFFWPQAPIGEAVPCGEVIGYFTDSADSDGLADVEDESPQSHSPMPANPPVAAAKASVETSSGARIIASPLARKMAKQHDIDLVSVTGSGPKGRIVKRDILATIDAQSHSVTAVGALPLDVLARIPLKSSRSGIASAMMGSLQSTAQVSSSWESDITELLKLRSKLVDRAEVIGSRISVNALIARALVYAVRQVPIANSQLIDGEIVIHRAINLGIAISMPGTTPFDSKLVVGVVHNINALGLADLDQNIKACVERIRSKKAGTDDLSGSTMTLSSTAGLAPPGMTTTPILEGPNTSLVGPSTPIKRVKSINGAFEERDMLPLSYTFDHQVMDGELASRFMKALHDALENPELLLL